MPHQPKQPWFRVGTPLGETRSSVLMACSFLLPIIIWCLAAYLPIWKKGYQLTIPAKANDKDAFGATYVEGDPMEADFFKRFQESIRQDNEALTALYTQGEEADFGMSARSARSYNKGLFKAFEFVLRENELFDTSQKATMETKPYYKLYYPAAYDTWRQIADGSLKPSKGTLSQENIEIIKKNWELLSSVSPSYDSKNFYSKPLFKLIPEGTPKIERHSYLPAPHEVLARAWEDFRGQSELGELSVWKKYGESLTIVFGGFLVACLIGLPLALLAGTFNVFSRLIEPFTDFFRYMPAPAFSTVLIAIYGLNDAPKIALVVIGTLPHLILMVANTTRSIEAPMLDAAQTLGAKGGKLITKVIVPGILPRLYNDLRILLGWAWTWLVIAELIGAKSGLTEIIDTQGRRFHFDHVYPIILLIGVTGFVTDQILSALRPILFPWTTRERSGVFSILFSAVGKLFKSKPQPEAAQS